MFGARSFSSPLQRLALRWSLFGQMLVVFARQVTLAHTLGAARGIRRAEQLEAMLYAALVQLSAEIAAAAPKTAADKAALLHLKTVHALLGVIALMARQLKSDLAGHVEWLAALSGAPTAYVAGMPGGETAPPAFIDSG